MTSVGSDTEACLNFPHFDGLVPAATEYVVSGWKEAYAADVVIMTVHCFNTFEGVKVPQLDGHVGTTGSEHFAILV